jgi:hypothetical protein
MKETPLLMTGAMIRAYMEGRKTQTRRIVEPQPVKKDQGWFWQCKKLDAGYCHTGLEAMERLMIRHSPYGQPGDRLWVKETFMPDPYINSIASTIYRATEPDPDRYVSHNWKPSIFMPRNRSRFTLTIKSIRVERVQDISEEDAQAEGIGPVHRAAIDPSSRICTGCGKHRNLHVGAVHACPQGHGTSFTNVTFKGGYKWLWETINGPSSWDKNPWVRVIEFPAFQSEQ